MRCSALSSAGRRLAAARPERRSRTLRGERSPRQVSAGAGRACGWTWGPPFLRSELGRGGLESAVKDSRGRPRQQEPRFDPFCGSSCRIAATTVRPSPRILKLVAGEAAQDPEGFDRDAMHEVMNPEIVGFFDRMLPSGQTRQTPALRRNTWMLLGAALDYRGS